MKTFIKNYMKAVGDRLCLYGSFPGLYRYDGDRFYYGGF